MSPDGSLEDLTYYPVPAMQEKLPKDFLELLDGSDGFSPYTGKEIKRKITYGNSPSVITLEPLIFRRVKNISNRNAKL